MAVIVQLLNGTNYCRDTGFQAAISAILQEGVRKGYNGELLVTTNNVASGMAFIRVTRTSVIPNEVFLVPVIVTTNTTISTAGNGYVILKILQAKINDGSTNSADGSNIASISVVSTLAGLTDPYIVLATLASGVITDARQWVQLDEKIIDDEIYYDVDAQATDSYQITIQGVKAYKDGKLYRFRANTTNIGAATLSINGLAAKSIRKNFNSVLSDGDIVAGMHVEVTYDAVNDWFQMGSVPGSSGGVPSKATIAEAQAGTDDAKFMTPLKSVYSAIQWGNTELGTYGEAISAGDLTANTNLVYRNPSDQKWYKITTTPQTWYYELGLALEVGAINATGKRILRKGAYTLGTPFAAAINPTFSSAGTGSDNPLGDVDADTAIAFPIDNQAGAEFILSNITIRAKQFGAPSGPMNLYIIAQATSSFEQSGFPAAFWDSSNNVLRGAILGQASIPQASFSGVYQNLNAAISGGPIRVPAGVMLYLVMSKGGFVNPSNYYIVDNNGFTYKKYNGLSQSWSGADSNTGNWSLGVTSNPTVGYSVKGLDRNTLSNGSYSLSALRPWGKVIGKLLDNGVTMLFDPHRNDRQLEYADYQAVSNGASGFVRIPLNFCPSSLRVAVANRRAATTSIYNGWKGSIRSDRAAAFPGTVCVLGNGSGLISTDDFIIPQSFTNNLVQPAFIGMNNGQNFLHAIRLEQGVLLYNSYPAGANFISGGSAGFLGTFSAFEIEANYQ